MDSGPLAGTVACKMMSIAGMLAERLRGNVPLVIAHRGFRACFPENTMLAFARSLGCADMIELDVRLAKDNQVVVFHDDLLTRTTNAASLAPSHSLRVRDWSLEELSRLDAGSWFLTADPFATLADGRASRTALLPLLPQRVPTLAQVLTWCEDTQMPLNIEMKDQKNGEENSCLVDAVIAAVRKHSARHLILFSSFNETMLARCRDRAPEIPRALLQDALPEAGIPALVERLQTLQAIAWHPHDPLVEAGLVSRLRQEHIAVNVFTVNSEERKQHLRDFGVTGIITDFPQRKAV